MTVLHSAKKERKQRKVYIGKWTLVHFKPSRVRLLGSDLFVWVGLKADQSSSEDSNERMITLVHPTLEGFTSTDLFHLWGRCHQEAQKVRG